MSKFHSIQNINQYKSGKSKLINLIICLEDPCKLHVHVSSLVGKSEVPYEFSNHKIHENGPPHFSTCFQNWPIKTIYIHSEMAYYEIRYFPSDMFAKPFSDSNLLSKDSRTWLPACLNVIIASLNYLKSWMRNRFYC